MPDSHHPKQNRAPLGGLLVGSLATLYGLPVQAGIVHVTTPTIGPLTTNSGHFDVSWDVDLDGSGEFHFFNGSTSYFNVDSLADGRGFVHVGAGGGGSPVPRWVRLPANLQLGPSLTGTYGWLGGKSSVLSNANINAGGGPGYGSAQPMAYGDNFVGFRFKEGAQTRYGWANWHVEQVSANSASLTITEWAYRDDGQAIRVGQTSVPTPDSLALLALGAGGLGAWRRRKRCVGAPVPSSPPLGDGA